MRYHGSVPRVMLGEEMPEGSEHFSLAATLTAAGHAFVDVICRIGFEAAMHGLAVAALVLSVGLVQTARKQKYGRPLLSVFCIIALFCAVLAITGTISLLLTGRLPQVDALQLNSVGLLGFWALVTLHLCMEEMNFQWFGEEPAFSHEAVEAQAVELGSGTVAALKK